ncbi:MAG: mannitol dehydrogenase family protein [Clostridia bacterium]|nr:mannitol dehydrogenase family protein [Clostridia bacterium]
MKVALNTLKDREGWAKTGVVLPEYDVEAMIKATKANPIWLHFGGGNIFRAFIAALQQRLLNQGLSDRGIIAADTFDVDNIRLIYGGFDNLTMDVTLNADATIDKEIIASVAEALVAQPAQKEEFVRLVEIVRNPSLQMISFTITEKGYAIHGLDGKLAPVVLSDIENGPSQAKHAMSIVCALLNERYQAGQHKIAVVSMDNCSHNGEKLKSSILEVANAWKEKGFVTPAFVEWVSDENYVSFPWSMIDKITPRPAEAVQNMLIEAGIEGMEPVVTPRGTYLAPFVNAERPQYLVIEDRFPNGRPPLEKAGVYFTDRDTVNMTERMKVTTCLNPLHTALAVYGCVLGYNLISDEMKDPELTRLVNRLGYVEGLPVVTDPGIVSPKAFIDEVVTQRLPNPFMPDTPQRIATDTSQKVGIRFGETIKSYIETGRDIDSLVAVPLALAGWLRYLMGVDDQGNAITLSSDPMLASLQEQMAGIRFGEPETVGSNLKSILSNPVIFGSNLYEAGLGSKIETIFAEEIKGPGAVRETLKRYLA